MKPQHHVIASAVTCAGFYGVTRSVSGTAVCFLSGIFIDIDHHFDLWLHKKKITFDYQTLWNFCEKEKAGRLHLIFHSYELFALLWASIFIFKLGAFWWGLAVGATVHIILDEIFNPLHPLGYFFWYRMKNKFDRKYMYRPEDYRKLV